MNARTIRTLGLLAGLLLPGGAATAEDAATALAFRFAPGRETRLDLIGGPGGGRVGSVQVEREQGRAEVELEMPALPNPQLRGPLYTTYVLWALGPEGQAERLAELPHGRDIDVKATASLPGFAVLVTAEPHGLVARPGSALVARAVPVPGDDDRVVGSAIDLDAADVGWASGRLPGIGEADLLTPLLVLGARRAVQIARFEDDANLAEREMREAQAKLDALEQLWPERRKDQRAWEGLARDVMRLAENVRAVAAQRREEEEKLALRRNAAREVADAEQRTQTALSEAEKARQEAEAEREAAREALAAAQRERAEAERARVEADAARTTAQTALSEAERARAQEEAARAEAERAQQDKAALQQQLERSLSAILETRREARGLIVSLSDVLFDTGRATLTAGAREKLSRVAGILLAYPGAYKVQIEGHTDSVGSEAYNQRLSESRARSVHTYLLQARVPPDRIVAVLGLGESTPVADNMVAAGRQRNRRVELVIDDRAAPQ
jgi:outer membrane protein OmpA-like peptidoglycan-associated protein